MKMRHDKSADCTCEKCKREALEYNRAHFWETFGIFETEINALLKRYGL